MLAPVTMWVLLEAAALPAARTPSSEATLVLEGVDREAGVPPTPNLGPRLASILRSHPGQPVSFLVIGASEAEVARAGGEVLAKVGPVISARASHAAILRLAPKAKHLDVPQRLKPALDVSRVLIGVEQADFAFGFAAPHRGAGVLIAAYDSGVDVQHPDLRLLDGKSRVVAYWDQDGARCTTEQLAEDLCPAVDPEGHGTHVLSIAASGGPRYRGVAPEAELIAARSSLFEDLVGALAWFHEVAEARHAPLVVNLSLGGHEGAHDGTSLEAQAIDAYPHLVVAAAGNDGQATVHARATLVPGTPADLGLELLEGGGKVGAIVEIWGEAARSLEAQVVIVQDGAIVGQSTAVGMGDPGITEELRAGPRGPVVLRVSIDAEARPNPFNGKTHLVAQVVVPGESGADAGQVAVRLTGEGALDAWVDAGADVARPPRFSKLGALGLTTQIAPDTSSTLSDPATAATALAVSSFVSRVEVQPIEGPAIHFGGLEGALSSFSAHGPSLAPDRTGSKPDLAAPGQVVVGASSRWATDVGGVELSPYYRAASGTSFAVPHVAGAAALLLEVEPTADKLRLRTLLLDHADDSPLEGTEGDARWGRGRIDVAAALAAVAETNHCSCATTRIRAGGWTGGRPWMLALVVLWCTRRLSKTSLRVTRETCTRGTATTVGARSAAVPEHRSRGSETRSLATTRCC